MEALIFLEHSSAANGVCVMSEVGWGLHKAPVDRDTPRLAYLNPFFCVFCHAYATQPLPRHTL